jgi:uncharacterized protein (TIGR00251 family)
MNPGQSKPLPPYLKIRNPAGCTLAVYAQPNARKTAIVGQHGDALKIKIQAPPVDGKANELLQKWLAKTLGLPKTQVSLMAGETGRAKVFAIQGLSAHEVLEVIERHLD